MTHRSGMLTTAVACSLIVNAPMTAAADTPSEKLHALFEETWEWELKEHPTFASHLGDLRYNDRWPDVSVEAIRRRHRYHHTILDKLAEIEAETLSETDRTNYRLFRRKYRMEVEGHQYRWHLLPLNQRGGIQDAHSLSDSLPFTKVEHYEDWLARMRGLPAYMDQTLALMQEGVEVGMVHPQVVMQRVPDQIRKQIVEKPQESPFYKPFREFPDDIPQKARERLVDAAKTTLREDVVPAYERLLDFFTETYLPACTEKVGARQLPQGEELYAFRARKYTTTEKTPREIHELGKREVRRIREEMEKVIAQTDFEGTFAEFLDHLRTDSKFYYEDPDELLQAYRATCKRIDPGLVDLFGHLPRIPYGVEPIPEHLAPDTTTAYYRPPAADGSRAGTYFVNLYKPETRPKYEIEVLSLHEAVPGHHLQIARAMELGNLPKFRRYTGYTAYVEGWALYAESLGDEMGLYRDPYSKFGQLTYEMWRAIRLVVDTGMHAFGWSRQRAIDYFAERTAKSRLDIENEVDRYITWPGQALAYKIGELKIQELRRRAERELGDDFEVRAFHDMVLSSGAVTLDILEDNVDAWIARRKKQDAAE